MMQWVIRHGMKVIRIVAGLAILIIGCGLIFLPGPGVPLIVVGLTILAVDFVWARRLKNRLQEEARKAVDKFRGGGKPTG